MGRTDEVPIGSIGERVATAQLYDGVEGFEAAIHQLATRMGLTQTQARPLTKGLLQTFQKMAGGEELLAGGDHEAAIEAVQPSALPLVYEGEGTRQGGCKMQQTFALALQLARSLRLKDGGEGLKGRQLVGTMLYEEGSSGRRRLHARVRYVI